jgi:ketosteroid isomerase-like protein
MSIEMLKPISIQMLSAVLVLGMMTPVVHAADAPGIAPARAGVQKTIDRVNALLKKNASAQIIADAMYEDDLMITGEGEKGLYRDLKSFMGPLAEYVKDGNRCDLKVVDPIRASGDLAVAFIFEHCAAAKAGEKDDDARILYVFRQGAHGYRVTMEMFGWGTY